MNAPIGEGKPVPGPLPPHIACPTTCGTGSECTGIAVFDDLTLKAKTGIASRRLRPTLALIDPTCTRTLPPMVVAASGFDVLCHALESFTARPYTARAPPEQAVGARPMSQGRNPWSDVGAREALRLAGQVLRARRARRRRHARRARRSPGRRRSRASRSATRACTCRTRCRTRSRGSCATTSAAGYPQHEPMVPHGISVVVNAPSVFRATAATSPERHLAAAAALGADVRRRRRRRTRARASRTGSSS